MSGTTGGRRWSGPTEPGALLEGRLGRGHPGVLAGAVAPARDDQRVGAGADPGEPAGQDVGTRGRTRRRPCSSATAKVRRTTGRGTSDPSSVTVGIVEGSRISWPTQSPGRARIRSAQVVARVGRAAAGPPPGAGRPTGRTGQQHQVVEVGQHVAQPVGPARTTSSRGPAGPAPRRAAPGPGSPSRPVRAGFSRIPVPERVEHGHPAAPDHLEQAGHPEQRVGPQLDRVAPLVVHPSDDHVDRVEAGQRPQPDPVVLDHQVPALDQGVAEVGGQVGVLEVGLATGARG